MINRANKTIDTWWPKYPKPGNFGDIITPWLIEKLFGYKCTYVSHPFTKPVLIATGSILRATSPLTTVWGSGAMSLNTVCDPKAKYLAVRGPLSQKILFNNKIHIENLAFGDPALLTPMVYNPSNIKKIYRFGVFPHYVDYDEVLKMYKHNPSVRIINPINADVTKVIDAVLECENIISSSLHGLIIANAYNIPSTWVKFSNKLSGDDTKFNDYFQSVDQMAEFTNVTTALTDLQMLQLTYKSGLNSLDLNKLKEAFPL